MSRLLVLGFVLACMATSSVALCPGQRFPGDPGEGKFYYGLHQGSQMNLTTFEELVGLSPGIYRDYYPSDGIKTMTKNAANLLASNILPLFSIVPPTQNGSNATWVNPNWQAVADGKEDTWLSEIAANLSTLNGPVWLCFQHEPTNAGGDNDTYVAMYDHIIPYFASLNVTNVVVTPILDMGSFNHVQPPSAWISSSVLVVGIDAYNQWWTYNSTSSPMPNLDGTTSNYIAWQSVNSVFGPLVSGIKSLGLPFYVAEYGVHEAYQEPGKSGNYLTSMFNYLLANGSLAMTYFNSNGNSARGGWAVDEYLIMPIYNLTNQTFINDTDRLDAFRNNSLVSGVTYINGTTVCPPVMPTPTSTPSSTPSSSPSSAPVSPSSPVTAPSSSPTSPSSPPVSTSPGSPPSSTPSPTLGPTTPSTSPTVNVPSSTPTPSSDSASGFTSVGLYVLMTLMSVVILL